MFEEGATIVACLTRCTLTALLFVAPSLLPRPARANSLKYIGSILLIVHLMDICCSIWAVLSTGSFEDSYEKFVSSPSDIFSESVFDFLLLSILRAITFPLLTFVGSKWGGENGQEFERGERSDVQGDTLISSSSTLAPTLFFNRLVTLASLLS